MTSTTFVFLTHTQLVNVFRKGYCYSLDDKAKFEQGIDSYILPSVIKDMQFRVRGMGVKKQGAKALSDIKKDFSDYLKKEFWNYFHSNQSFASFHDKACNDMVKIFSQRYNNVTYGKGQKAVNMTFKYFYCFENSDSSKNESKFSDCHMPLDSKILEWYRNEIDSSQKTAWSYLKKDEYDTIQDNISKHISQKYNNNYTVLQAEFVIWNNAINNKAGTP